VKTIPKNIVVNKRGFHKCVKKSALPELAMIFVSIKSFTQLTTE
jgi:hypothetical protein